MRIMPDMPATRYDVAARHSYDLSLQQSIKPTYTYAELLIVALTVRPSK